MLHYMRRRPRGQKRKAQEHQTKDLGVDLLDSWVTKWKSRLMQALASWGGASFFAAPRC
jgi:hypothetical protein